MKISDGRWTFHSDASGSKATCHDLTRHEMEEMGMALRRARIDDFHHEHHPERTAAGERTFEIHASGIAAKAINDKISVEQMVGAGRAIS